jgi:hypothetical protein
MRSFVMTFALVVTTMAVPVARAADPAPASAEAAKAAKCEHGVKKAVCARCNPKLVPVFKAKGDWCGDHQVPESQCVKCNPRLAGEGVK